MLRFIGIERAHEKEEQCSRNVGWSDDLFEEIEGGLHVQRQFSAVVVAKLNVFVPAAREEVERQYQSPNEQKSCYHSWVSELLACSLPTHGSGSECRGFRL